MSINNKEHWHLEKKVSVGHLVTTVMIAVSALVYVQRMEHRIGLLEQRLEIEIARSAALDSDLSKRIEVTRKESKEERRQLSSDMRSGFKEVNGKLDQMLREVLTRGVPYKGK